MPTAREPNDEAMRSPFERVPLTHMRKEVSKSIQPTQSCRSSKVKTNKQTKTKQTTTLAQPIKLQGSKLQGGDFDSAEQHHPAH